MRTVNRHFVRHYLLMVAVMVLGMTVLGIPAGLTLEALGSSWGALRDDAPALMLLLMAFTMTAPMVWWMQRMGHSPRANAEMAAAMIGPTLLVIGVHAIGAAADVGTLLVAEHLLMLVAMFGVMLLRPEEYSHHHHVPDSIGAHT